MRRASLLPCVLAILSLAWKLPAAEDLKIGFDEKGLASITHNGVELVNPGDPRFRLQQVYYIDAQAKGGARQLYGPQAASQRFDVERRILVQEYPGFHVECAFLPGANRLDLQITLVNTGAQAICQCEFLPLTIRLPHTVKNAYAWDRRNAFLVDAYEHAKGAVIVTPTGFFDYPRKSEGLQDIRPLDVAGPSPENRPHHPVIDDVYWYDPGSIVPTGKTGTYRVSLVFGPLGATAQQLCPEAYDRYAKDHPMKLAWPDRRPIAVSFLCNSATGWKTNPRGYFQDSRVDVTTEDGVKAFGERLMKYADNCIAHMKPMDAQGIIVWDIEGQEQPHMVSYIGDPRALAKLSPEMERFSDAFMKKFRDAGFKTGITIRPTEIFETKDLGHPWDHRETKDPVANMSDKIKYAQKRWGCTIFYLDSSVFGAFNVTEEQKKEVKNIPWIMPEKMLEKLTKLHPDCLISPEFARRDLYRFGAPYSSPNLGDGGTDPLIRRLWPQAFRLIMSRQDLMEKRWEQYADSVEKGDVLMFCCWGDFVEQTFVKLLYQEAAMRKRGALTALAAADVATLAEKARDSAEETRYAAATALGKTGTPAAVSVLAELLKDESPLVRKQALAGLARAARIDDPACLSKLAQWIKVGKDPVQNALRSQAAEALAKGGEAVVPELVAVLADDKAADVWPYAVRALGRTATTNASAGQALIACFNDKAPAKARLRNDVIEALGLLHVKEAVPALLPVLDKQDRNSEDERAAVVVALGRIGDARAIPALLGQFKVTYSTVVVYWIQGALDTALRSITGESGVIGKDEWLRWDAGRKGKP